MRVINPKNGTQIRLSKRYQGAGEHGKVSYRVDRAAVAEFNRKRRVHDVFRRRKETIGNRVVVKKVLVRTIYKHPSN